MKLRLGLLRLTWSNHNQGHLSGTISRQSIVVQVHDRLSIEEHTKQKRCRRATMLTCAEPKKMLRAELSTNVRVVATHSVPVPNSFRLLLAASQICTLMRFLLTMIYWTVLWGLQSIYGGIRDRGLSCREQMNKRGNTTTVEHVLLLHYAPGMSPRIWSFTSPS